MSEWREVSLSEIADVIGGGTPSTVNAEYYGGDIPWICPRDLTNYTSVYISRGVRNITELGLQKSSARLLPKNTVLMTSRAPIGYLAIASNELCTNQGFKSLVVNPELADYRFVYYLLKRNIDSLKSLGTGTTFAEISGAVVKNYKVRIPSLSKQQEIAEILSSIDDKIELNNKINAELEKLAQTIYKQWFVDFEFPDENGNPYKSSGGEMVDSELGIIPKGWSVGALGQELDILMGQSPKGESLNESGNGEVFYQGRSDFGFRIPSVRVYTTSPNRMANQFDTLLSVRAPVGDINMSHTRCCIGRGIAAISHPSGLKGYTYNKLKYIQPQIMNYDNEGTVFGSVNKDTLNKIRTVLPALGVSTHYENDFWPLDLKIYNLTIENLKLVKLRDLLIKKLIK